MYFLVRVPVSEFGCFYQQLLQLWKVAFSTTPSGNLVSSLLGTFIGLVTVAKFRQNL